MSARSIVRYLVSARAFKLPRSELEDLQLKRLRSTLAFLEANVPAYRERFRNSGFDPKGITKLADIRRLPPTTKSDILDDQRRGEPGRKPRMAKSVTSSGTTGIPVTLGRSFEREVVGKAISYRGFDIIGLRPWSRVATLWSPQRYWKSEVLEDGTKRPFTGIDYLPVRPFGRNLPNLLTLEVNPETPAADGERLKEFRPEYLFGRPSYLRRIARHSGEALGVRPKVIVTTGEVMTRTGLEEMRRAYGTKVVRSYGSSDVGKLAMGCLFEAGMHTWEDFMLYEVLKDGEEVSEGEIGELVVTTLYKDYAPRVRFRTGDYVKLGHRGLCECGSSTTRIASVEGRRGDWLVGKDGTRFLASDVAEHIESAFGLRDFRVVQEGAQDFLLLVHVVGGGEPPETAGVGEYLGELTGGGARIRTLAMSPDDYWTKVRPVTSQVG